MFGIFEDIVEATSDLVGATCEVAAGVAVGAVVGVVKAPVKIFGRSARP